MLLCILSPLSLAEHLGFLSQVWHCTGASLMLPRSQLLTLHSEASRFYLPPFWTKNIFFIILFMVCCMYWSMVLLHKVAQAEGGALRVGSLLDLPQPFRVTKIWSVKVSRGLLTPLAALHCSVTTILQELWWITQWWNKTMPSDKFVTITVFSVPKISH